MINLSVSRKTACWPGVLSAGVVLPGSTSPFCMNAASHSSSPLHTQKSVYGENSVLLLRDLTLWFNPSQQLGLHSCSLPPVPQVEWRRELERGTNPQKTLWVEIRTVQ